MSLISSRPLGVGYDGTVCCMPSCRPAAAARRSHAGGISGHLQAAHSMETAESSCRLFWPSDFVSDHRAEIRYKKDCMPPGACSGCDVRSYLQVARSSISFRLWILAVLSARSVISW